MTIYSFELYEEAWAYMISLMELNYLNINLPRQTLYGWELEVEDINLPRQTLYGWELEVEDIN